MALTKPRKIVRRQEGVTVYPVLAAAVCIQSGLAILADGYARPGRAGQGVNDAAKATDAATYQAVGVFLESVTGGVADGEVSVAIQAGEFNFANSAGADAVSLADVGHPVYVVDDETIARTSAGGIRAVAGILTNLDSEGAWVRVGPAAVGRRTVVLPFFINQTDLLAGTPAELVSPVSGFISRMSTVVQTAVTTGGPITAAVGVTAVNGLSCVIADGAAKGSLVSGTPTAGHASTLVAAGARIQVVPDAAFATAGAVNGFVEITF